MPEAVERQGGFPPVVAGGKGGRVIMPGTPVVACAQMHEIGLAIAAAEYSYAVQTGAARGKPGHADAGAQLDKAAIVGGADIAGKPGIIDII